jgi:hypothetical protein
MLQVIEQVDELSADAASPSTIGASASGRAAAPLTPRMVWHLAASGPPRPPIGSAEATA